MEYARDRDYKMKTDSNWRDPAVPKFESIGCYAAVKKE